MPFGVQRVHLTQVVVGRRDPWSSGSDPCLYLYFNYQKLYFNLLDLTF